MNKTALPDNWPQQLADGGRETRLELLPLIERFATAQPGAYAPLLPLAENEDFAVRLRALLVLGRLGQGQAFMPLLPLLAQESANHWRLALLDTLFVLPYADKITPLLPFLAEDQRGDGDAYFLAGLVWFFGGQGPAAIAPLIEHVLSKPARARRLKDGLLAEAIFLAAGGNRQLLADIAESNPAMYRFCSNRVWPKTVKPHFGLYPNPDYLLQIALKNGFTPGQFQRLYHWSRDKLAR